MVLERVNDFTGMINNESCRNLLPEILRKRNEAQRFSREDKRVLVGALSSAWPSTSELLRIGAECLTFENGGSARWGSYPDGERYVHSDPDRQIISGEGELVYVVANLETSEEVTAVRAIWDEGEIG
jgi:hypothetical protein